MSTRMLSRIVALLLVTLAPAVGAQTVVPTFRVSVATDPVDSMAIVSVLRQLRAAFVAGDTAKVASLFTPDAVVMLPRGEVVSFPAYRRDRLAGTAMLWKTMAIQQDTIGRVTVNRETGWVESSARLFGVVDGMRAHAYIDTLIALRKTDAGWRITMLHDGSR